MIAVTISNGQVTVGATTYPSIRYKAFVDSVAGTITIKSWPVGGNIICWGVDFTGLTLNGVTYGSNDAFVVAFNASILAGDSLQNVQKNTNYPDTLISSVITVTTKQQISTVAKPGYVTFKTPTTNTGVIYIGLTGVSVANFALEAGQSVGLEFADLSLVYVLASVAAETVHVLGAYKS